MAATVGVAFVDVRPDMDGFNKDLARQAGQAGSGFGAMFKKAVVPAMAAAGAAAGVFLAKSVSDASNLQETLSKVTTIFGDSADEIVDWSKTAATSMGLSQEAALDAAGSFGNLFQQIGFATGVSQDMSTNLVGMASDLASFHNIAGGAAEVTDMMSAAMRGEYDSLQRVIPTINAAAVEQKALAQTGKDSAKELTNQEKAAATYALIMEGAGAATGDFARTSDGLANQQRILSANFDNISATVGAALLPAVNAVVSGINDWLLPAFESVWGMIQTNVVPVVEDLIEAFQTHLAPALEAVWDAFSTGASFLSEHKDELGKVAAAITIVLIPALINMGIQATINFAIMIVGWVRSGIQATVNAAVNVAAWVVLNTAMLASKALAVINFAIMIAQWVALGAAALVNAAIVAAGWLIAFWPVVLIVAAIIAVIAVVWIFWDEIVAALTLVKDFLFGVFTAIWGFVVGVWTSLWDTVSGAIKAWIKFVIAVYTGIWNFIVGVFNKIKTTVLSVWTSLWDRVKAVAKGIWDWIVNAFNSIRTTIVNIFNSVRSTITGIWNNISDTISRVINNIKGFVQGLWDTIKSLVNRGIGALNTLIDGANNVTDKLPGDFVPQIPNIPMLAAGGIVTRPTLALIGEAGPEAVVPLSQMGTVGGGGGDTYIVVKIGDEDITAMIESVTRKDSESLARTLSAGRRI